MKEEDACDKRKLCCGSSDIHSDWSIGLCNKMVVGLGKHYGGIKLIYGGREAGCANGWFLCVGTVLGHFWWRRWQSNEGWVAVMVVSKKVLFK